MLTRRGLIVGAGAGAAVLTVPAGVLAAVPKPAPAADDEGFLSFLAAGEAVLRDLYRQAPTIRGAFDVAAERRLAALAQAKRRAILRVTAALGADAPQAGDFGTSFPARARKDAAGFLALADELERLMCGVELNGVGYAADPATRLLLGRLLAADVQALSTVRALAGRPALTGLIAPIDLEAAGTVLDTYLTSPNAPKESA